MLNRMDVVDPPNSAPQYIDDNRMMAEVGSSAKVSGISSDTPFGAPKPGSTPTMRPIITPPTISIRCMGVMAMPKPCIRRSKFPIAAPVQ